MNASLLLLALAAAPGARAAESVRADLAQVDELYFHRDQPGNLEKSEAALDAALAKAPEDPELLWRQARGLERLGEKAVEKKERLRLFEAAEAAAAKAAPGLPKSAEPHFWAGVAMGRRGETRGVLKSLFLVSPIRKEMAAALAADPRHGGAHRVLGEILWQLPGFVGGDKKKAVAEFEESVRLSPNYTANYPTLATAYVYFGRKADAAEVLKKAEAIQAPDDPAAHAENLAKLKDILAKARR